MEQPQGIEPWMYRLEGGLPAFGLAAIKKPALGGF